jgi:CheY-like chemotaxis protein
VAREAHAGTPADRLRVLIVDDNRDLADSLGVLMRLWGYEVSVAYDGVEGLQAAREQAPDCVLLDLSMPGMDGYALARVLRCEPGLKKTRLIAHTAYSGEEQVRQMDESGFDFRLTKPASPAQLEELLKMLEQVKKLAEQTEELARRNVTLAGETKELLTEVKEDIKEVKEDIKEIKDELKEVKGRAEQPDEDK